jgi:hypothetical protein
MRFRPTLLLPIVLVLSLVVLVGCGNGEQAGTTTTAAEVATTETAAPDSADELVLTQECSSPAGYRLSYPEDWVTNEEEANQLPPCSLFDPESVELGETLHIPESIAIRAGIEPVVFDSTVDRLFEEELDRQDVQVAGRAAVRLETRATGEGLLQPGVLATSYRVDLGDRTFIATTYDVDELDYETKQEILDRMMETLRFVESGSRAY